MGPHKKVGFEFELGSDISFTTLRRRLSQDTGITGLKIHPDGSVDTDRKYNAELVTPVWNLSEGLKNLSKILKWLDKQDYVETNTSCGFHVNLSFKKPFFNAAIDPLSVLLLTDDIKWLKKFRRLSNHYCITPKAEIGNCIKVPARRRDITLSEIKDYLASAVYKEYAETMDIDYEEIWIDDVHFFDKYFSINLIKLANPQPYIEYRFLGGKDYHKKGKDIFAAIDDMASALDKSITENKYEGVKTRYLRNMLTPQQRQRIKTR